MSKLPTDNIDKAVAAAEADAGHEIPGLREGLEQIKAGKFGRAHPKENLTIRAARNATGLSQSKFAELIDTPVRTLQEWEQSRLTPPGAAVKLCQLIINNPAILAA